MTDLLTPSDLGDAGADARLAAIVDSSYDAIISKDLTSIIRSWNHAAERLFGYTADEAIGHSILMLIPESLQGEEADIIGRVRRGDRVASYETIRMRKDGTLINVSLTVSPIRNSQGVIVGASKIARDITAAKENERRIRFLMREVNHRVKNQFAVILSMIREIGKRATSAAEFEAQVRSRIMALSQSQDMLVSSDWSGARLFDLIQEHLRPFGHESQVTLSGPLVALIPNAVQNLGMAFHELGTNSAKYGALSGTQGRVTVSWDSGVDAEGEKIFSLVWDEAYPAAAVAGDAKEEHKGFGTVVLRRVAPQSLNGTSTLDRIPGHVRWSLLCPLSAVVESATV